MVAGLSTACSLPDEILGLWRWPMWRFFPGRSDSRLETNIKSVAAQNFSTIKREVRVADPAYHFYSDPNPDPAYHFNSDPDPAFHYNADTDPAPHQSDGNLRPLVYRRSILSPQAFIVSSTALHGSIFSL